MLPAPTRLSSIFADNNLPIIRTCVGPPRSNRAEFTYWPPRRFVRPRSPAVRCFHDFAAAAEKSLYPLELAFALIGPIQTLECIPNRGFQFLTAIQVGPHRATMAKCQIASLSAIDGLPRLRPVGMRFSP